MNLRLHSSYGFGGYLIRQSKPDFQVLDCLYLRFYSDKKVTKPILHVMRTKDGRNRNMEYLL